MPTDPNDRFSPEPPAPSTVDILHTIRRARSNLDHIVSLLADRVGVAVENIDDHRGYPWGTFPDETWRRATIAYLDGASLRGIGANERIIDVGDDVTLLFQHWHDGPNQGALVTTSLRDDERIALWSVGWDTVKGVRLQRLAPFAPTMGTLDDLARLLPLTERPKVARALYDAGYGPLAEVWTPGMGQTSTEVRAVSHTLNTAQYSPDQPFCRAIVRDA